MQKIKFAKTRNVKSPDRGTPGSAGLDFYVPIDYKGPQHLKRGESALVPSGVRVSVPPGHAMIAFNKSGQAVKNGLQVGACVVDEDYQGEVHLHVTNIGKPRAYLRPGDKLVQFLLMPVTYAAPQEVTIEDLFQAKTKRGSGALGSTGTQ